MSFFHGWSLTVRAFVAAGIIAASSGKMAIAAINAIGNVAPTPPVNGSALIVGDTGVGYLTIDGGNQLATTTTIVGDDATSIGFANVAGQLSTWNTTTLTIGRAGIGELQVSDGAMLNVSYASGSGDLIVGSQAGGIGTVVVDGFATFLRIGNSTTIGSAGTALLRIENNGFVDATNTPTIATDLLTIGALGRVEMGNGKLRAGRIINNGAVIGDGWIRSVGDLQNNGRIASGSGDFLTLDTALDNSAYVEINGGEIAFTQLVTNLTAGSEIALRDGIARFRQGVGILNDFGVIASLQGSNDIFGLVQNSDDGRIVVAGASSAIFHDNVVNSGSIEIAADSEAIYLGSLTAGAGASLSVGLSENEDEMLEFGQLRVSGTADLAGSLKVSLEDGYVPSAGDTFEIVSAAGVTGSLALMSPPDLPGLLGWDLDITSDAVVLRVIDGVIAPVLLGDYNLDGTVNAADYTVWRNQSGKTEPGLRADGNNDGTVNGDDLAIWKLHFGESSGTPASLRNSAAVPEPTSATAMLVVLGVLLCEWRRRR